MFKYGRKYLMATFLILTLVIIGITMPGMYITDRMVLWIAAAVVGCVYMMCETKIDCASAPLNLPDDLFAGKEKPPESTDD